MESYKKNTLYNVLYSLPCAGYFYGVNLKYKDMMIMAQCSEAIVEITHRYIVDISENNYEAATCVNPNLRRKVFVLILEEAAWLMAETEGGQVGRFYFPVGDATHLRRIIADENNTIKTGINIGY